MAEHNVIQCLKCPIPVNAFNFFFFALKNVNFVHWFLDCLATATLSKEIAHPVDFSTFDALSFNPLNDESILPSTDSIA